MTTRFLRHKPTGVLYVSQPAFAVRADFEEVVEQDTHVPPPPIVRRRARTSPLMPEAPQEPDMDRFEKELSAQAARGLP